MSFFFSNNRRTFFLLVSTLVVFIATFMFVLLVNSDNFYTNHSDDFQQYFSIMEDFAIRFKNGSLSFYSFNDYLGASMFSDAYYIPLDIFSLITLLLSCIMQFEFAFSTTELLKMAFGVLTFAYFLKLRGNSNKSWFFVSLIYMVCGANVVLMAFPTYYSLIFYIPLGLVCLEYFFRGKEFILPLYVVVLIFYDFYIAYTVLMFLGIMYIVKILISIKKENWKSEVIKFGRFLALAFLGVAMGMIVLLPNIYYILEDTYRTSRVYYWYTFFSDSSGYDTVNTVFKGYLSTIEDKDQFFRVLGELFSSQQQIGFYGFQNSYITDHLSMYITMTGLVCLLFVYSIKKDRECFVYKLLLPFEIIMVSLPLFYMLFSGNQAPYARWLIILSVFNLIVLARVIHLKDFKFEMTKWTSILRNSIIICVILVTIWYYLIRLYSADSAAVLSRINSFSFDAINEILARGKGLFGLNYYLWYMIGGDAIVEIFSNPLVASAVFSQSYYLAADIIFMLVSIGIVILITGLSYIRRINFVPIVLSLDLVFSAVMMCYVPIASPGRIQQVNKRDFISNYLDAKLPYDGTFERVLLADDLDLGLATNITRTNAQMTNLELFHSFYDANADEFGKLFFSREEGAGKHDVELYNSIYMDLLLGRKYIMVKSNSLINLPSIYQKVPNSNNGEFMLYKADVGSFIVYDSFASSGADYADDGQFASFGVNYTYRQAYFLNNLYTKEEVDLKNVSSDEYVLDLRHRYLHSSEYDIPWDSYVPNYEQKDYLGYRLDDFAYNEGLHQKGVMKFFYSNSSISVNKDSTISTDKCYLGYYGDNGKPVMIAQALGQYFYYDLDNIRARLGDKELYIFVQNTDEMRKASPSLLRLILEFSDRSVIEEFVASQTDYTDKSATITSSSINISFTRKNTDNIVVFIPVTYNDDWVCSNPDYRIISANGGLTGVVIEGDELDISFSIKYEPSGVFTGAIVSGVAFMGYGVYVFFCVRKKEFFEITDNE